MEKIKAIISDADGTLVNTKYLIRHGQYEAAIEYLSKLGVSPDIIPTFDTYEIALNKSVGGSTRETFEKTFRLLFHAHPHLLSQVHFDELNASLTSIQDRIAPDYVKPFSGLSDLLAWFGKNHISLGIFTSGSRHHIIRNFGISLPHLGYTKLFLSKERSIVNRFQDFISSIEAVYGIPNIAITTCDDVNKTKPDPEGIVKLMSLLNVSTNETVVLGDLACDIQAAHAAGLHAIGVAHGFGTAEGLLEAGAKRVFDNLAMLPLIIENHNNGVEKLF
jgi:phosphoglycolate phosphatase-like HAD superfamily hydrolase